MDNNKEIKALLNDYSKVYPKKVYALSNWLQLNAKKFGLKDAFKCIYDYADGNTKKITDIIEHLTAKRRTYGRTQVYSDGVSPKMDIIKDNSGNLALKGYDPNDSLPLKGRHTPKNNDIFRKYDNQPKEIYKKTEEKLYDIGKEIRNMYPSASKMYLTKAIAAVRAYAQIKKIHTDKVLNGLKAGRLVYDDEKFRIMPKIANEHKNIIITDKTAQLIAEEMEMSEYKFYNNVKSFLKSLIEDPVNTVVPFLLRKYNITKSLLLREMTKLGMIEKKEKINDKDEYGAPKTATMMIRYMVPKKNFERNLKKLYIRLFEKNLPPRRMTEGGATGCDSSGQFSQPLFGVQRREIADMIEAATTSTVGDYQYDVPLFGDKETLSRKNGVGGSVSVNYR